MANTYDIGDVVRITGTFTSTAGTAQDPSSVYMHYDTPTSTAATTLTYGVSTALKKQATGIYYYDMLCTGVGAYEGRFTSTGTGAASEETFFYVRNQRVTT